MVKLEEAGGEQRTTWSPCEAPRRQRAIVHLLLESSRNSTMSSPFLSSLALRRIPTPNSDVVYG